MKKYTVKVAFSLLEKILMLPGDEVYCEGTRLMMNFFSIKTRKQIGSVSLEKFALHMELVKNGKK